MEPQTNNEPVDSSETEEQDEPVNSEETGKKEHEMGGGAPSTDVSENKAFAILGYILPFLFFLPLLNEKTKNVPFARFHANQQLILLIVIFVVYFLQSTLYMMFMSLGIFLIQVLNMVILVMAVIGIWNAYKGEMKELPFIGHFKILK